SGDPATSTKIRGKKILANVRLPILAVVADSWLAAARQVQELRPRQRRRRNGHCHERARLIFAPIYGETYSGIVELARTSSAGPSLGGAHRLLVRWAYRFQPASGTPAPPSTETLVKEAVADLIASIDAGRRQEFEAQLRGLADLHIFLFEIAEVPE